MRAGTPALTAFSTVSAALRLSAGRAMWDPRRMRTPMLRLRDALCVAGPERLLLAALATAAAVYMAGKAHQSGVVLADRNGFGSDFAGTIWTPDRAILHWRSPYPASADDAVVPAVYLPPIFVATLPLALLPLHVATWVWFGILFAAALGVLAVLRVRDPWCYALWILSLPVAQSLTLGNATLLLPLGIALAWRWRDRRVLGALAVAATVSIKTWLWPLGVWLLLVRPRTGIRAAALGAGLTLAAWAAIGFHGILGYPALMHTEAQRFVRVGSLFVAVLVLQNVPVYPAAAAGLAAAVALLALAAARRRHELEALSLALLAALVATPVAWAHYLALAVVPIAASSRSLSPAWLWFPALWLGVRLAHPYDRPVGTIAVMCLFAAVLPLLVIASAARACAMPEPAAQLEPST